MQNVLCVTKVSIYSFFFRALSRFTLRGDMSRRLIEATPAAAAEDADALVVERRWRPTSLPSSPQLPPLAGSPAAAHRRESTLIAALRCATPATRRRRRSSPERVEADANAERPGVLAGRRRHDVASEVAEVDAERVAWTEVLYCACYNYNKSSFYFLELSRPCLVLARCARG